MIITSKVISIAIIVVAILLGLIVYYVMSGLPKAQKRKHLDELVSQLINFVIYIWVGKILLNLSLFFSDPMAVLAYPSNAESFYIAVLLSGITIAIQAYRKKLEALPLLIAFTEVFLISSFLYEFIQLIWEDNSFALGYTVLSGILIVIYYWLRENITIHYNLMLILTVWSIGMMVLALTQPFVTLFGYLMKPWFITVFYAVTFTILLLQRRKRDS